MTLEVRLVAYNTIELWEEGERFGGRAYNNYYDPAFDLGLVGKNLPFDWLYQNPQAKQGWADGCEKMLSRRPDAIERLARSMENDRHLYSSPCLVRAFARHRLQHEFIYKLLRHGPASRLERAERTSTWKLTNKRKEEIYQAAIEKAKHLMRRKSRMALAWLQQQGFPWPEDMRGGFG